MLDIAAPTGLATALQGAWSGDTVVLRELAMTIADFLVRVLVAAAILAATLWLAKRLAGAAARAAGRLQRNSASDQTVQNLAALSVRYLVILVGGIIVLQQLGVQIASILAVLGAASLAIGLALQGALSNVAAGVMLFVLQPYKRGDKVELNGRHGVVVGIDLFNTKLTDYDGLTLYLPNGKVFGDMIVNVTRLGRRRIDLSFGVGYDDDLDLALTTLIAVARRDHRVLAEPAPWSRVTALADSSVTVTLRCWTAVEDWQAVRFDLVKEVKETFDVVGLSFPFPHEVQVDRPARRTQPTSSKL